MGGLGAGGGLVRASTASSRGWPSGDRAAPSRATRRSSRRWRTSPGGCPRRARTRAARLRGSHDRCAPRLVASRERWREINRPGLGGGSGMPAVPWRAQAVSRIPGIPRTQTWCAGHRRAGHIRGGCSPNARSCAPTAIVSRNVQLQMSTRPRVVVSSGDSSDLTSAVGRVWPPRGAESAHSLAPPSPPGRRRC